MKLFVKNYYNSYESKHIKKLCAECEWCIKAKATAKPVSIKKYPIPLRPFQTISSDLIGPLRITEDGHRYIMVVRDFTSRYTILTPLKNKEADSVINALRQVFAHYGPCETLLTDNGKEYVGEKVRKFCDFYNVRKVEITPYHPESQGLAERINREVNKLLRIYTNSLNVEDWSVLLPVLQLTINSTYNSSLNENPFYCLYGYDSPTITFNQPKLDYSEDDLSVRLRRINSIRQHCRENLLKIQERYTCATNVKRAQKIIKEGQRVYAKLNKHLTTTKLDLPISGPFVVTEKRGNRLKIKSVVGKESYEIHADSIILADGLDDIELERNTSEKGD